MQFNIKGHYDIRMPELRAFHDISAQKHHQLLHLPSNTSSIIDGREKTVEEKEMLEMAEEGVKETIVPVKGSMEKELLMKCVQIWNLNQDHQMTTKQSQRQQKL